MVGHCFQAHQRLSLPTHHFFPSLFSFVHSLMLCWSFFPSLSLPTHPPDGQRLVRRMGEWKGKRRGKKRAGSGLGRHILVPHGLSVPKYDVPSPSPFLISSSSISHPQISANGPLGGREIGSWLVSFVEISLTRDSQRMDRRQTNLKRRTERDRKGHH